MSSGVLGKMFMVILLNDCPPVVHLVLLFSRNSEFAFCELFSLKPLERSIALIVNEIDNLGPQSYISPFFVFIGIGIILTFPGG